MLYAPVDIVFALLILIIAIRAALKGFVEEVLGAAWLILGVVFAFNFYPKGAELLRASVLPADIKILPEILAFTMLFLIVFISIIIITFIIKDILARIQLGGVDHFLGALFGILEGLFAAALIIFIINVQPLFDKNAVLRGSVFNRILSGNVKTAQDILFTKQRDESSSLRDDDSSRKDGASSRSNGASSQRDDAPSAQAEGRSTENR
ncbi:MAG: CvpA family protein [Spirochaetaceae bacterium]|jgi:membrane protein required for colicin V production|nr:CvpA family protein [Spirochaetaceae bacterium]